MFQKPRETRPESNSLEHAAHLPPSKANITSDQQPIAQLYHSFDVEAENNTQFLQNGSGNITATFGGMHFLKKMFNILGELFGPVFLRSLISLIWPKIAEQDYVLSPRDHRKAKEMWAQLAMGF